MYHRLYVEHLAEEQLRAVSEDVRIASHEAGHAIARWVNGREIERVTIIRRVDKDGNVVNGSVRGDLGKVESDQDDFSRMVELAAGGVGEMVHLGATRGLKGSDLRKATEHAKFLADSPRAIDLLIRAAEAEAEHLIRQHELASDRLIGALLDRRTMTGEEVIALLERNRTKVSSSAVFR